MVHGIGLRLRITRQRVLLRRDLIVAGDLHGKFAYLGDGQVRVKQLQLVKPARRRPGLTAILGTTVNAPGTMIKGSRSYGKCSICDKGSRVGDEGCRIGDKGCTTTSVPKRDRSLACACRFRAAYDNSPTRGCDSSDWAAFGIKRRFPRDAWCMSRGGGARAGEAAVAVAGA